MQGTIHAKLYFERRCARCRSVVTALVHDYGERSFAELNAELGMHDFPVAPLKCPSCGQEDWPEHAVLYDAIRNQVAFRLRVGSADLPVVGGSAPYAVVRSPEEQAEYERGLAKMEENFRLHGEEFWRNYCAWAAGRWRDALKELTPEEWRAAYDALGLALSGHPSPAAYRRDAEGRFKTPEEMAAFWRAANADLVGSEFLWYPPDQWPVERWLAQYGRERVMWLLLHFPLPEELERWRTEKLAQAVPQKPSGPQAALWERIGQLSRELERQRRRAAELSRQVLELRQENARLSEELGEARRRMRELEREFAARPQAAGRDPEDVRKIRAYKALIGELKAEVKRLAALVPREEAAAGNTAEEAPAAAEGRAPEPELRPEEALAGKIVAVFGRLGDPVEGAFRVVWHDGNRADARLESLAGEADVIVVLTRLVSHEAMWALKEAGADRGVPVVYLRETGLESILRAAARALGAGAAGK